MSNLDLQKLRELASKATPDWKLQTGMAKGVVLGGPLRECTRGEVQEQIAMFMGGTFVSDEERVLNAEFAVHARMGMIELLDRLERAEEFERVLRTEVAIARERLGPAGWKLLEELTKLRAENQVLFAEHFRFLQCLEVLANGVLADGTHVEGRVCEFASEALSGNQVAGIGVHPLLAEKKPDDPF